MKNQHLLRDVLEDPPAKPSIFRELWGILSEAPADNAWMGFVFRWGLGLLIVGLLLAGGVKWAEGSESWHAPTEWRGERSTVELDCEAIGLVLAPWGVDGSAVRCINQELMEKETGEKGRYWEPTRDEWMHRYCSFNHGTSMAHYDPITFVFWCHKAKQGKEA